MSDLEPACPDSVAAEGRLNGRNVGETRRYDDFLTSKCLSYQGQTSNPWIRVQLGGTHTMGSEGDHALSIPAWVEVVAASLLLAVTGVYLSKPKPQPLECRQFANRRKGPGTSSSLARLVPLSYSHGHRRHLPGAFIDGAKQSSP